MTYFYLQKEVIEYINDLRYSKYSYYLSILDDSLTNDSVKLISTIDIESASHWDQVSEELMIDNHDQDALMREEAKKDQELRELLRTSPKVIGFIDLDEYHY